MSLKRCFVVMGYGIRDDLSSKKRINLDKVYQEIIKPVVTSCGYECIRGDEVLDSGLIDESMYYGILESDLVVADLTTLNPNAIYELGVRHGVRRFRTIIMMESHDKFFFDLNHNRTITYSYHDSKKAFSKEATNVKERLKNVIEAIEKEEKIDSPLYKFITDLNEPVRQKNGIGETKGIKSIYQRINDATILRKAEQFEEAIPLLEKLVKDIPSDPYFRQQLALCTYKAEKPNKEESLKMALKILEPIADSLDPETSGLIGAIYKRKFLLSGDMADIDNAIICLKKAYNVYEDYYNGENYAFCLLLAASNLEDVEQKEEYRVLSRMVYKEVFNKYKDIVENEVNSDYEIWLIATLAVCALSLKKEDLYNKYDSMFLAKADSMMKSSYNEQKEKLIKLLNNKYYS